MSVIDPSVASDSLAHHQRQDGTVDPAVVIAVCLEVGASGRQSAILDGRGELTFLDGVHVIPGVPVLVAAPGLVHGTHVVAASNLGWFDLPVAEALGVDEPVVLLRNDAEAAALGEHVLRGAGPDLVYVGLGTGVGGAVVRSAVVTSNLFGHDSGFGDRGCPCGARGCLETVAAGWALSEPATPEELHRAAEAVASAVLCEPLATPSLVVIGGGLARRHPELIDLIARALPDRDVQPTASPSTAKSAAAWGLLHMRLP